MTAEDYRALMMGYIDGELTEEEKKRFEEYMSEHPEIKAEMQDYQKIKRMTEDIALAEPEEKIWQQYWSNVYNRTERFVGYIIFSVSAICLLSYAGFKVIESIIKDPAIGTLLKVGLMALIVSLAVLFVSVLREKLYFSKRQRYKDVQK